MRDTCLWIEVSLFLCNGKFLSGTSRPCSVTEITLILIKNNKEVEKKGGK